MAKDKSKKISSQQIGIAGEYFVAAELTKLGFNAAITLRNSQSFDILATDDDGNNQLLIQVKTTWNAKSWPLNKKVETTFSKNHFYVFVNLKGEKLIRPDYYIIHSNDLAKLIQKIHNTWLETPGKKNQKHNPTDMREFRMTEELEKTKENWGALFSIRTNG